jgi:serine/threonine protein kinase
MAMSENATPVPAAGAPPQAASTAGGPAIGSIVADRYRLEKQLGEGAMGAVYLAEHVHMRKRFALKVLHQDAVSSPELVARFEREAVAAANIMHPGVAAATDFGRLADGSFFLVLEYVAGKDLRWLITEGALPVARALDITRQLLLALGAAHAKGVVHRDIKPENVMLVARDGAQPSGRDVIKVLDFGIAKVDINSVGESQGQQLTRMGMVYGTPSYMSPEQAMGEPVDARADLYAVGVMLHEMINGKPPFEGDAIIVIAKQVNEAPPPLVSPRGDDAVTAQVRALVDALLAKDRTQRPADANAAVALVDLALASLPSDRAATVFGDTLGASPRPPVVDSGSNATTAGAAASPWRKVAAQIDQALEPLAKKTGYPARHVRLALSAIAGLLVLLLLVLALKPSKNNDEDDVSGRRKSGTTAPVATTAAPSVVATAQTAKPTTTTSTTTTTPTTATTGGGGSAPKQQGGAKGLVNKIKSVFK